MAQVVLWFPQERFPRIQEQIADVPVIMKETAAAMSEIAHR